MESASTVETFPTEVLEHIFLQTRAGLPADSPHVLCSSPALWPDSLHALLSFTVCQVSRRWNQIAMNLPSLWTSLFIDFARPLGNDWMWSRWLKRSRGSVLTIVGFLKEPIANELAFERCCCWYARVFQHCSEMGRSDHPCPWNRSNRLDDGNQNQNL